MKANTNWRVNSRVGIGRGYTLHEWSEFEYPGRMGDIDGVAGVLIWTSPERFPAMAEFYVDVLGLEPRSNRHEFVNFAFGEIRITIAVHDRIDGPAGDPERLMLNLAVSEIQAVVARLTGRGVAFSRPPEQESWGGWIATFADPDGNVLQLLEPAPGSGSG